MKRFFFPGIYCLNPVGHSMPGLYVNASKDPFNDLDDPFLPGHKNFNTKLLDEHQSISGLHHFSNMENCLDVLGL